MAHPHACGALSSNPDSFRIHKALQDWLPLCYDKPPVHTVEKSQLMTATEIDRTLQRLAHEIVEKSGGTANLALIGVRRRGVPLANRIAQAMRGIDGVDVPVGTL